MRRGFVKIILLGAASLTAMAFSALPAVAQVAQPGAEAEAQADPALPTTPSDDAEAPASDQGDEGIVVTGSRAVRDGTQAPTPVTVATAADLQNVQPASIAESLKILPQFQNSTGDRRRQSVAGPGQSGNFLNLRGLGANRGLVLMDGRRIPATSSDGAVDTNIIPELLVQRVDVVTGGASAAYGSDAVSGVVNYVLDNKLVGLKGVTQSGISTYGDGPSYRLGLAYGLASADDRFHLIVSGEYSHSEGIRPLEDRPLQAAHYLFTGGGTTANPWKISSNTTYASATFGGLPTTGPLVGLQFAPGGALVSYTPGTPSGLNGVGIGGQGAFYGPQWLTGTLRVYKGYARASYDLGGDTTAWVQANYANSMNYNGGGAIDFRLGNITIFNDNAFLSPAATALLGTTPSFKLARINLELGPSRFRTYTEFYDLAAGLEGKLGRDFDWKVSVSRGRSDVKINSSQSRTDKFYAAIDAVRDPSGNIVCRVTLTNPGLYPGCTPLNLFGVGAPSAAAIEYVRDTSSARIVNETTSFEASVSGSPFSLWAGPVSVAVGGEYRELELNQTSSIDLSVVPPFTGIQGIPAGASYFFTTNIGTAQGSQNVKEVFGEIAVPLAKDLPFAKDLDINLAARYTDYSTSGTVTTWKAGLSWVPVDGLRFRATRSRDIRAPSLIELFAGPSVLGITTNDPHTGVQSLLNSVTVGNPNLTPEIGDTLTVGAVAKPAFLPGLSLSVDYYDIKIRDAMVARTLPDVLAGCEASGGTGADCALITRPLPFSDRTPANTATQVITPTVNASAFRVKGLDFELGYRTELGSIGSGEPATLNLRLVGSYLLSRKSQVNTAAPVFELAGQSGAIDNGGGGLNPISYPKLRMNFVQDLSIGNFALNLSQRFIGAMKQSLTQVVAPGHNRVAPIVYFDMSIRYKIGPIEPFFSVVNIANTQPPLIPINRAVPGAFYPTNSLVYDTLGRYFTAGVRFKF